jgi:hypothetical protein
MIDKEYYRGGFRINVDFPKTILINPPLWLSSD